VAVEWYELLQDARSSDCERVDARTRSAQTVPFERCGSHLLPGEDGIRRPSPVRGCSGYELVNDMAHNLSKVSDANVTFRPEDGAVLAWRQPSLLSLLLMLHQTVTH